MKNDVNTKLGEVTFSYNGFIANAMIDDAIIYSKTTTEIDAYSAQATTATDYLVALIEMYIKDGGRLNEFQDADITRIPTTRNN